MTHIEIKVLSAKWKFTAEEAEAVYKELGDLFHWRDPDCEIFLADLDTSLRPKGQR